MSVYFLTCLPLLALHHFDASVFVVPGDHWVDASQTHPTLHVRANSDGYDGQFYYRMAVRPFSFAPRADGIAFDHPAKRMTRVLYPLLAWAASFGRAAAAAWAMFAVNLAGLSVIARLTARLASRWDMPAWVPWLVVAWPGFIVALTHDTTEIVSTAFLLGSVAAYLDRRLVAYAALAGCAVLTRETTLAVFAGMLLHAVVWRPVGGRARLAALAACAAPFVAFMAWRQVLAATFQEPPQAHGLAQDLGWPLLGAGRMLLACVTGARPWASTPLRDEGLRAYVLASAVPLLAFCSVVLARLPGCLRRGEIAVVATAWLPAAALMTLLTAGGPWVDPDAYLRAFTECFVVGCLVLGLSRSAVRLGWLRWAGILEAGLAWAYCMVQLR